MIKRYRRVSFSWRALNFGHRISAGPAEATFVVSRRPNAPRSSSVMRLGLQGATFTGLPQYQRKFSNVANEHHFPCGLGGDLSVNALATVATVSACPTSVKICIFVLKDAFGRCYHYSCFKFASPPLSLGSLTPAEAPSNRCGNLVQTTG